MREAYESRSGEPVRITIDTDLMHAVTLDDDLSFASGRWVATPVDGSDPGDQVHRALSRPGSPTWCGCSA